MSYQNDIDMKRYYRERAPIYDDVYSYPERQNDLRYLEEYVRQQFVGVEVLEIAAGTGYWTQFLAPGASSVLATDATEYTLSQLNHRPNCNNVPTLILDAYALGSLNRKFGGAFAGLWYSHVPKQRRNEFLSGLHQTLLPGAKVLLIDNSAAQCERLPISHTDQYGNTYQDRTLKPGSTHKVLKNFPAEAELIEATKNYGSNFYFLQLNHYWLFQYEAN